VLEHGKAIEGETESGEIRKNWVRESDGGDIVELRTNRLGQQWRGPNGGGLTRGSLLYQLTNRETRKNTAARSDSLRVESSTASMTSRQNMLVGGFYREAKSKCAERIGTCASW